MPEKAINRPFPAVKAVQQSRLGVVLADRVDDQLAAPPGLQKGMRDPPVAAARSEGQDHSAGQLGPGVGAAEHHGHEVFVHRPQVLVEIGDQMVGVLQSEADADVAQAAASEFRHYIHERARLPGPAAVVGEDDAHAVTACQAREPRQVVGGAAHFRPVQAIRELRGSAGLAKTDLGPQVGAVSAARSFRDERLDDRRDDAESTCVIGLLERRHRQWRPHPGQFHLVLPERVEFRIECAEVLVAPVPHDFVDANALEHLGALTGAATQCIMGDQVARGHLITLAPSRYRGLGRRDKSCG